MRKPHSKPSVRLVLGLAVAGFLLLSAESCDTPATDRSDKQPDGFQDTTNVVIWKNADQVPNVATFCADKLAWAATLSSDGTKQPQLVRVPEHDEQCGGR